MCLFFLSLHCTVKWFRWSLIWKWKWRLNKIKNKEGKWYSIHFYEIPELSSWSPWRCSALDIQQPPPKIRYFSRQKCVFWILWTWQNSKLRFPVQSQLIRIVSRTTTCQRIRRPSISVWTIKCHTPSIWCSRMALDWIPTRHFELRRGMPQNRISPFLFSTSSYLSRWKTSKHMIDTRLTELNTFYFGFLNLQDLHSPLAAFSRCNHGQTWNHGKGRCSPVPLWLTKFWSSLLSNPRLPRR